MKKKMILWISRDRVGYEIWSKKPIRRGSVWTRSQSGDFHVMDICSDYIGDLGVKLKEGSLAKVTIERQY